MSCRWGDTAKLHFWGLSQMSTEEGAEALGAADALWLMAEPPHWPCTLVSNAQPVAEPPEFLRSSRVLQPACSLHLYTRSL